MANNYAVKVEADISNYNKNIDSAADSTKKFQDAAEDANKSVNDLGKKSSKSVKDLLNQMKDMEKGGRSVSNYRKKLSSLTRDIQDLTINYRALSDEMKNSDLGREAIIKLGELQKEAAQYKDAIGDAQQAIRQLSSDTFAFDAAAQGIDLMSSALQTYISLGFSSADTTEKLSKVLGKLKTAEQGAATAIKVLNMLNKDTGVIMQAVGAIQSAAAVKAAKLAQATGKATIAQKAFNLVAKANPYVLLATAIAALVVGIGTYIAVTNRATTAAQDAAKAAKNFQKALEDGRKEANETIAKFMVLQSTWKSLKTEAEKTQWIKDNQDAFRDLGLNINDVNDAEKAFVKYSSNIIKAMALRAEAAKLQAQLVKEYEKALEKSEKMENDFNGVAGAFDFGTRKDWEAAGLKAGEDFKTGFTQGSPTIGQPSMSFEYLTESGKEKMKAAAKKNAENYMTEFEKAMQPGIEKLNALGAQADALEHPLGSIKDGSDAANDMKDNIKAAEGSLTAASEKLSKMKQEFEAMAATDPGFDKMKKDVQEQEKLVAKLQKKYETIQKGAPQQQANLSRLSQLREELDALHKVDNQIVEGTEAWDEHYKKIATIENEIKNLEGAIEAYKKRVLSDPLELPIVVSDIKLPNKVTGPEVKLTPAVDLKTKKEEILKAAEKLAEDINERFKLGLIDEQTAKAMIANINASLEKENIKATVHFEFDENEVQTQISNIVSEFDKLSGIGNGVVGSMNDIYESVSGLGAKLEEAENGWESFFAVFQTGMTVFQSFTTILETFSTIMDVANGVKAAMTIATEADTQATKRNTQEKLKNAGATAAEAIASGTKSAADIPMVGWAVALAAGAALLAMLIGAMSSVKKFAGGGINSFHGDKVLARVNAGEMVLNNEQQRKLFKMINEGPTSNTTNGQVEFKIRGTELVGVLGNVNRKNSMI